MSDKKDDNNSTPVTFPKEKRRYNKVNRVTKDKNLEKLTKLNNILKANKININNNIQYDPTNSVIKSDITDIPNINSLLNLTPTGKIRSP